MKRLTLVNAAGLCIFVFFSCGDTEKNTAPKEVTTEIVNNPATAAPEQAEPGTVPKIYFYEEKHDFGKITQGQKVSYSYKFKNTGGSDLVITSAQGSCGCTVPNYPKDPIKPGDEGVIDVVFNSEGKSGKNEKTITVITNTNPNTKVLVISANIIVPEEKEGE